MKNSARTVVLKLCAWILPLLFATNLSAQITVFPECNFTGAAVSLPPGDYTTSELNALGVTDNSISSVIVSEGFGAQIYTSDRFGGSSGKLLEMNSCLDNTRYGNNISSLSVFRVDESGNALATDPISDSETPLTEVELYSECNYQGRSISLKNGKYTASDLQRLGLADNSISSIRVPDGMKIDLFENDFYRGRSGALGANSDCLVDRFNDQVSSVIVSGEPASTSETPTVTAGLPPIEVYSGCDYQGQGARLPAGEYSAKDLTSLGVADNSIASIRVPAGMEAVIFEHDFQRGKSTRVSTSVRCLNGSQFEKIISSLVVLESKQGPESTLNTTPTDTSNARVTIYTDCRYRGRFAELPVGEYDGATLRSLGFADNTISAIKVDPGMKVTVYENDRYQGGQLELREDESCLSNRRADDAISSLVVQTVDSDKPFVTSMTAQQTRQLEESFQCVKPFVDKGICNGDSWSVIQEFCKLSEVELMSDGYFEGHVNAGNCTTKNWPILVERISDPSKR